MKTRLIAASAALLAAASPAAAQNVEAKDPPRLAEAMKAAGYAATLGTDQIGDPMISSAIGDTQFKVLFYNCTAHRDCATVQFHVGYTPAKKVSLDTINAWNSSQRFGRAYLDRVGDPILQMDVDLDDGGLSRALFVDNLEFWASVLGRFEKHIGFSD